jgi:hypothetical protein
MLLKIPTTRTPKGALKFVALIIKIFSCNKKKKFHGLRSKLPQMFYFTTITFFETSQKKIKWGSRVQMMVVRCQRAFAAQTAVT